MSSHLWGCCRMRSHLPSIELYTVATPTVERSNSWCGETRCRWAQLGLRKWRRISAEWLCQVSFHHSSKIGYTNSNLFWMLSNHKTRKVKPIICSDPVTQHFLIQTPRRRSEWLSIDFCDFGIPQSDFDNLLWSKILENKCSREFQIVKRLQILLEKIIW